MIDYIWNIWISDNIDKLMQYIITFAVRFRFGSVLKNDLMITVFTKQHPNASKNI